MCGGAAHASSCRNPNPTLTLTITITLPLAFKYTWIAGGFEDGSAHQLTIMFSFSVVGRGGLIGGAESESEPLVVIDEDDTAAA